MFIPTPSPSITNVPSTGTEADKWVGPGLALALLLFICVMAYITRDH